MSYSVSDFWRWFQTNNKAYLFLNEVDDDVREELMSSLLDELHSYCPNLYFQIGGDENGIELVITAEGDTEFFAKVEDLVAAAPLIESWKFVAFKQSITDHFNTVWEGIELSTEQMWFAPLFNPKVQELGLRIFLKGFDTMKDDEAFENAIYVMLDTILGEKNFALNVGYVDIEQYNDDAEEAMYPILELPDYLETHIRSLKN